MVDYLYVSGIDQAYQAATDEAQWKQTNNGLQSSASPGPSSSWTTTSQTARDSPAVFPAPSFYDADPDLAEILQQDDSEHHPSNIRKTHLSHSRSFPDLHQSEPPANLPGFRAASASLELAQPVEFNTYSFESHMNPASSLLFPPSNSTSQQFFAQDQYNQYQEHSQASSSGLQPTFTGMNNFRPRSDSEGSGSWAGINTPITPSDMNLNSGGYKPDLGSYGSAGFSQNSHPTTLHASDLPPPQYPSSAPADSAFASSCYPPSLQGSHLSPDSTDLQAHSGQHAYAINGFPAPPVLQNVRSGSTSSRAQLAEDSSQDRTITLGHELHRPHRSTSPNTHSHALQSMPSGSAYSRSLSLESENHAMNRNRSMSATPADFGEHLHDWNPHRNQHSLPMSAPIGQQFSNLHLDAPDRFLASFMPSKSMIPRAEREALLA